jgi:hypothetical protein
MSITTLRLRHARTIAVARFIRVAKPKFGNNAPLPAAAQTGASSSVDIDFLLSRRKFDVFGDDNIENNY